ncbi:MAG: tRNA epoxyqueuosine(34) reductase QueG [Polyangiaceae bacterium]
MANSSHEKPLFARKIPSHLRYLPSAVRHPSENRAGSDSAPDVRSRILEKGRALGFDAIGIASAVQPLDTEFPRYKKFIDQGMHGEMAWLENNGEVRRSLDNDGILAGAKSVICLARRYQRSAADEAKDPPTAKMIARYARGRDYHNVVRRKLRKLAAFVRTLGDDVRARPMCDDAPVLERAWAARSGLGFVGKNGLIIVPGQGSFVLLGEVVTTLELLPDAPMNERCGSCTRCLDACPTQAFVAPFVLDPRSCIAYLTIEKRGPIAEAQREKIGDHLFGCDDCQTVCPFNASARGRDAETTRAFEPLDRWSGTTLVDLLDPAVSGAAVDASPVKRATPEGIARNAAIVLGNQSGPSEHQAELAADSTAKNALEIAAAAHPSAVVREAAAWAAARLRT